MRWSILGTQFPEKSCMLSIEELKGTEMENHHLQMEYNQNTKSIHAERKKIAIKKTNLWALNLMFAISNKLQFISFSVRCLSQNILYLNFFHFIDFNINDALISSISIHWCDDLRNPWCIPFVCSLSYRLEFENQLELQCQLQFHWRHSVEMHPTASALILCEMMQFRCDSQT